jgi:drug/metabolite transporter (DMT)-like permease
LLGVFYFLWGFRLLQPQNQETGKKLGIATGMMFTLPILAFYIAMWIFSEKKNPENWAGGAAIIITNLIIGGYCYSALTEEDDDPNDRRGPKTGSQKERTD